MERDPYSRNSPYYSIWYRINLCRLLFRYWLQRHTPPPPPREHPPPRHNVVSLSTTSNDTPAFIPNPFHLGLSMDRFGSVFAYNRNMIQSIRFFYTKKPKQSVSTGSVLFRFRLFWVGFG